MDLDKMIKKITTALSDTAKIVKQDIINGAKYGEAKIQELNYEQLKIRKLYDLGKITYDLVKKGLINNIKISEICKEILKLEEEAKKANTKAKEFGKKIKLSKETK